MKKDSPNRPSATDERCRAKAARKCNPVDAGDADKGAATDIGICVVVQVDVETTVPVCERQITALALRRFRYDTAGAITRIDRVYSWRVTPNFAGSSKIARSSGVEGPDCIEPHLDVEAASRLLNSATVIYASNMECVRPLIELLLPAIRVPRWGCVTRKTGLDCREFGGLGTQTISHADAGPRHVYGPQDEVDAIVAHLRRRDRRGRTAMSIMLDQAIASD